MEHHESNDREKRLIGIDGEMKLGECIRELAGIWTDHEAEMKEAPFGWEEALEGKTGEAEGEIWLQEYMGRKIREKRMEQGLRQTDLAETTNIERKRLMDIELGRRDMHIWDAAWQVFVPGWKEKPGRRKAGKRCPGSCWI